MIRLNDILEKITRYLPGADLSLVEKAYVFSAKVHQGQVRLSGEPYLIHPLEVAAILADMRMDIATVVTGLLHDTVEDTHATPEEIRKTFSAEIASLVDGLTKISRITLATHEEQQAENFRKMILAMAKDIRIVLIKLADRLHNMRTLEYLPPESQIKIAQETLDIYAPLANRLGIDRIKTELEDLSFRYLYPIPPTLLALATSVHDLFAYASVAMLVIHLAAVSFAPRNWPLLGSIFRMRVSRKHVQQWHPLWFKELTAREQSSASTVQVETKARSQAAAE